jgi:hypothetical protein
MNSWPPANLLYSPVVALEGGDDGTRAFEHPGLRARRNPARPPRHLNPEFGLWSLWSRFESLLGSHVGISNLTSLPSKEPLAATALRSRQQFSGCWSLE